VRGARPGDILVVEVLDITPHAWGWTAIGPHGVLGAEMARALVYWDLRGERAVPWSPQQASPSMSVRVPPRPFCGVMGVAPAVGGEHSTTPPRAVGGNLDVRGLVPGSTLFLPIGVDGALSAAGAVPAEQGDGEVCGTGIECGGTVTLRFDLRRDRRLTAPEYRVPAQPAPGPRHGVTGIAPDLMEATRAAVRGMIAYLGAEHGLDLPRGLQVDFSRVIQARAEASGGEIAPDEIRDLEIVQSGSASDNREPIQIVRIFYFL